MAGWSIVRLLLKGKAITAPYNVRQSVLRLIANFAIGTRKRITMVSVAKNKYLQLSELGSRLNLSFSSYLDLGKTIVAMDGIKKCLLVLDSSKELKRSYIISLNEVTAVTVKKNYGSIDHGDLEHERTKEFLETLELHFELTNEKESIVLIFYDSNEDDKTNLSKSEENAEKWQKMLSKMLLNGAKKYTRGDPDR